MASKKTEAALAKLGKAAGPGGLEEALILIGKLFRNIYEQPSEPKFRKLNPNNAKLQSVLFRHDGAFELFEAAGFLKAADGSLELPQGKSVNFIDVNSTVQLHLQRARIQKETAEMSNSGKHLAKAYQDALNGGCKGAGLAEIASLKTTEGGREALEVLEKIIGNIRLYPAVKKYQSLNLNKSVGKKVGPALPLLSMVGFKKMEKPPDGENWLELPRLDLEAFERLHAMVFWATRPSLPELNAPSPTMSHALGAVLGAAVGDALAGPLAGKRAYEVSAKEVDKAMEMCGGGVWSLARGQVSDNIELALCQAEALAEWQTVSKAGAAAGKVMPGCCSSSGPLDGIATRYGAWGGSLPFHFENANGKVFKAGQTSDAMIESSRAQNKAEVGTGALVRVPLMAVFGSCFTEAEAVALARMDTALSHPGNFHSEVAAVYALLLINLMNAPGNRKAAMEECLKAVERTRTDKKVRDGYLNVGPCTSPYELNEVLEIVANARDLNKDVSFSDLHHASSSRVAFGHAVRHIAAESSFEHAMRATLAGGGDVVGNCTAVGALVGAAVGLEGIPARWIQAILACDTMAGQNRPKDYHPNRLPELCERIFVPSSERKGSKASAESEQF